MPELWLKELLGDGNDGAGTVRFDKNVNRWGPNHIFRGRARFGDRTNAFKRSQEPAPVSIHVGARQCNAFRRRGLGRRQ